MSILKFGYRRGLPENVEAAWGARWIWPHDQLPDRQSFIGGDAQVDELVAWINGGPLRSAMDRADQLIENYELAASDDAEVVLYEDDRGIIKANPQSSYGYLYVCAFLKPVDWIALNDGPSSARDQALRAFDDVAVEESR